ncbi:MAG: bifunctional oligoribonuclease/PAP phosphatase NrnA [Candidatus Eiseniibacteriota bacterium]|nr:MAG: bifunctional oligoribonuclease/PAP phosphatase NrnA [Candidatus Eisenbacteria bacterium]
MSLSDVAGLVRSSSSFLVTSHVDLDGDAVGSELGLALALEGMGKKVAVVNEDRLPSRYEFLPGLHLLLEPSEAMSDVEVAFVLDCTSMSRIGSVEKILANGGFPIVNMDHHESNARFGSINLVRPDACAAAVLVLELISELGEAVSPDVATCLYTAVLAETGSFRLSNTSREALTVSADLVQKGADPAAIAAQVFGRKAPAAVRLVGEALRSLEVSHNGDVTLLCLARNQVESSGISGDQLEGVVNFAMAVEDARVAVFLRELSDGVIKVSLRSDGTVDVDLIARGFGGGGHSNAAGARVPGTLTDVKGRILGSIAEVLDR